MPESPTPSASSKAIVFARRSGSTLILWALVAWVFISRRSWAYLGMLDVLAIIATVEYFRMARGAGVKCFPRFGILLAAAYSGAYHASYLVGKSPPDSLTALAVFIALAGAFILQLRYPSHNMQSLQAIAVNLLGFVYITFLFNFASDLLFLIPGTNPGPGRIGEHGAFLLLWLLTVTKFTDMGAYVTGSLIGRHKMIPHVSPGKTWEGLGGALLFSQAAACGLYAAFPAQLAFFQSWSHVIILGFLLAMFAVIGDLAESIVKRAFNAKDSGRLLPGIGGALDLIDSVCFTAPALYFYLKFILLPRA